MGLGRLLMDAVVEEARALGLAEVGGRIRSGTRARSASTNASEPASRRSCASRCG
ncbi:hypothetical protein [Streptomyces sp. H27-C3]|uniref:hypothetical protein n=1 Tax=Streptomyces sp. H27-C3 TaxID=3046305 RepID=UPI0032D91292